MKIGKARSMTTYGMRPAMADGVTFDIDGLDEILKKFKNISDDLEYKGGRFALRKAAQVVRDAAKENARIIDDPETRADIEKNIVERWSTRTFKTTGDLKFRVGVMGGAGGSAKADTLDGLPGGDTRHWRYLEFGTEKHRAQPFMRRALTDNINKAIQKFVSEYDKKLTRLTK